jgi:hypothetical protein
VGSKATAAERPITASTEVNRAVPPFVYVDIMIDKFAQRLDIPLYTEKIGPLTGI